jgi:hypothetical protein
MDHACLRRIRPRDLLRIFSQSLRRCALIVVRPLDASPAVLVMGIKPYRCHWQLDAILLSPSQTPRTIPKMCVQYPLPSTVLQPTKYVRPLVSIHSASMSYVLLLLSSTISSIFATIGQICQNPLLTASCVMRELRRRTSGIFLTNICRIWVEFGSITANVESQGAFPSRVSIYLA